MDVAIAIAITQKRRAFRRRMMSFAILCTTIIIPGRRSAPFCCVELIPKGETSIVEALPQQHDIREGVVHREDDHSGQDALKHGSQDIKDISGQPDDDEKQGEAIGGPAAEVFDDLRRKDDDPAGDGDGAEKENGN